MWSLPKQSKTGFSTIELLIAFSVGIIFLTSAIMVSFSDPTLTQQISIYSGQTAALHTSLDNFAFSTSTKMIGDITGQLLKNWNYTGNYIHSNTQYINTSLSYTNIPTINDISPCIKEILNDTSWGTQGRSLTFGTAISNINLARELGGDCDPIPPSSNWIKPKALSSHSFVTSGKPVAIDVLNKIVYITDDAGSLQIYDASMETEGNAGAFTITPYIDTTGKILNDVDVANIEMHRYAFVARHDVTSQFQVIDVTTPGTYSTSSNKTLSGNRPPNGSFPQGWRVFYFDKKVYVTTRETAGSEFHIFDVSTPLSPIEIGPGFEVNGTANDLLITAIRLSNHTYKLAFLATDRSSNEIMILNVTNPNSPSLLTSIDLPSTTDALCLQLLGNTLYIGRQKTSGNPELYVYHLEYGESGNLPTINLSPVGNGLETGFDITQLRVAGRFAFVSNPLATTELRVWDISHPDTGFPRVDTTPLSMGNKIVATDYEFPYIYIASQANSVLQLITNTP
jgi:hypothetical protein